MPVVVEENESSQIAVFAAELKRLRVDLSEQLRRLRADHNALCASLDSAGVLPANALDQNLSRGNGRRRSQDLTSKKPGTKQIRSSSSSMLSERLQTRDSFSSAALQSRAPQQSVSAFDLDKTFPENSPSHPSKYAGNAETRVRSDPRRSRSREPEGAVQAAQVDLYDLAHPLLFPNVRPAVKAKALEDVRKAITNGKRPDVWRGPDTPLLGALEAGSRELVQLLILCKANPNVQNDKGASVLHRSVFHGEIDYAVLFLEAQADPNLGDQHDQTPIFFAPTTHICDLLCRKNADTNIVNLKGQSALHLAALANLGEVLVWLSQHVSRQLLDMRDNDGHSAEDYARKEGMQPELIKRMRPYDPHHPSKRTPQSRTKKLPVKKTMRRSSQVSSKSSDAPEPKAEDVGQADEVGYIEAEDDDQDTATIKLSNEEDQPLTIETDQQAEVDLTVEEGYSNAPTESNDPTEKLPVLVEDAGQEDTIEAEAPLAADESEADPTKKMVADESEADATQNMASSKKKGGFGIPGFFRSSKAVRKEEQ